MKLPLNITLPASDADKIELLAALLEKQGDKIMKASSPITAAFHAAAGGMQAQRVAVALAKNLGVVQQANESHVDMLDKIVVAAEAQGIDATRLKTIMPDVRLVVDACAHENTLAAMKIAQAELKKRLKP